ncbi:hypothetical protein K1719_006377 [Acacia pycnantha]|nr:hypothetical protein K1719_006377 [Acacia pycnantha]
MDQRGGYGRGRSGHYRRGPRGRDGGRSGGGPPRGGGGRGFRHQSQPHDDRSSPEDTPRGGYGRGGSDRRGRGRGGGRNAAGSSVWEAGESSQSRNSPEDTRRGGYGRGGSDRGGRGRGGGRDAAGSSVWEAGESSQSRNSAEDTRRGGYGRGGSDRGGRGSGRNAAGSSVWKAFLSSQSPNSASDPVPEMENLKISPPVPSSSHTRDTEIFPIPRPDGGGALEKQTSKLRVNHFPIRFNPDAMLRHYNVYVKVKPTSPVTADQPQIISKSELSRIREKLCSNERTLFSKTVYDGVKNIISAVCLPKDTFEVTISAGGGKRTNSYEVTFKLVKELDYGKLSRYLNNKEPAMSVPRDILQGMDIVFKENPAKRAIGVGRCFYPSNPPLLEKDLCNGVIALRGFQQSLKPTSQGLSLCLDYSVLSFRKPIPVLDFVRQRFYGFRDEHFWTRVNQGIFQGNRAHLWDSVKNELIGLKVYVTHRSTGQKYTIVGLSDRDTVDITFPLKDPEGRSEQVSILHYFRDKHKKDIAHKNIPCLDFGEGVLVPMEFCILVEGQRYPKENLERNASKTLKDMSLVSPKDRKSFIQRMVESSGGPTGGGIIGNFELEVDTTMTAVSGHIIEPPILKVRGRNGQTFTFCPNKYQCQWNLVGKFVMKGEPVKRWGIIDFTISERFQLRREHFIHNLQKKFRSLGIDMNDNPKVQEYSMSQLDSHDSLSAILTEFAKEYDQLQFILCVMSEKHNGYKTLKWISETEVGIVTQCCLSNTVNEGKDQNLTNLALKINAKLGGSNFELENRLPCFAGDDEPVMFIGADVNHPAARDVNSPSIAAIVGTVNWPAANRYAARVRSQPHRKEQILNFGTICLELVDCYKRCNKERPKRIVIFRDGVSEGQFGMVLNEELGDLKSVFRNEKYIPTITLVVAQKRHQTRLFLEEQKWPSENVCPGTVVDKEVVHPFEFDFYLCSHHGSLGTSKPTHYHVLYDDHKFTSDDIEKLIYDMCFTFARCTKPVSLVPPVYYADLVAYRGRKYYEAKTELESSKKRASLHASSSADEDNNFKLHENLKDIMFFV